MPGMKGKSPIDIDQDLAAHANDPTEIPQDFSRLPGGITGGVAELVSAAIGEYKKGKTIGKKFVRLAGSVKLPLTATRVDKIWDPAKKAAVIVGQPKEVPVKGLQTSVMFPLCETISSTGNVTSQGDNVSAMMNQLRLLAGDDFTKDIKNFAVLEAKLKVLPKARILFRFGTQQQDPTADRPNPGVFDKWYDTDGVDELMNGQATAPSMPEEPGASAPVDKVETATDDLDDLVKRATAQEQAAIDRLTELAVQAGMEKEAVEKSDTWQEVVDFINAPAGEGQPAEGEAAPEEWKPAEGDVYAYRPLDKLKRKMKAVEVIVQSVDEDKQRVNALNNTDKKTVYKSIKWTDLETAE